MPSGFPRFGASVLGDGASLRPRLLFFAHSDESGVFFMHRVWWPQSQVRIAADGAAHGPRPKAKALIRLSDGDASNRVGNGDGGKAALANEAMDSTTPSVSSGRPGSDAGKFQVWRVLERPFPDDYAGHDVR